MADEKGNYGPAACDETIYGQEDDQCKIADAICEDGFENLPIKKAGE